MGSPVNKRYWMPGMASEHAVIIGCASGPYRYGPGGYRFSDFLRFGLPLNLIMWGVSVAIIPHIWAIN